MHSLSNAWWSHAAFLGRASFPVPDRYHMCDEGVLGRQGPSPEPALPVSSTARERSSEGASTSRARRSDAKLKPKPKPARTRSTSKSKHVAKKVRGKGDAGDIVAPPAAGSDGVGLDHAAENETASHRRACENIENSSMGVAVESGDVWPEMPCVPPDKCTGCGKEGVVFWDDMDGVFVCHNCEQWVSLSGSGGEAVVMEGYDDLVNDRPYDPRGAYYGSVPVVADDTGTWLATNTISTRGTRREIHGGRPYNANVPLRKFVEEYGNHLKLTKPVVDEAMEYASRIHKTLPSRSMKLQLMALSALYAAIRMNRLPLTLVDLVAMLPKGDLSVYAIGRAYRVCLAGLQLQVPVMEPAGLVPKLFEMLLRRYDGELDGPTREAVLRDAKQLIGFISGTEARAQHPTVLAATSIYLAMEMNMLAVPRVSDAARAFRIGETALKTKANNIRHSMEAMAGYLVYGENITARNAMKYARVFIKMSSLKSRAEASGDREAEAVARDAVKAAIKRELAEDERCPDDNGDGRGGGYERVGDEKDDDDLGDLDVDEYLRL